MDSKFFTQNIKLLTLGFFLIGLEMTLAGACNVTAYSTDQDPNGLNIRLAAPTKLNPISNIPVVGIVLPPDDELASQVQVIGSVVQNNWLPISLIPTDSNKVRMKHQDINLKVGYVSNKFLASSTRVENTKLREKPMDKAKIKAIINDNGTELRILDCAQDHKKVNWVKVLSKEGNKSVEGWVKAEEDLCPSTVTTCI